MVEWKSDTEPLINLKLIYGMNLKHMENKVKSKKKQGDDYFRKFVKKTFEN